MRFLIDLFRPARRHEQLPSVVHDILEDEEDEDGDEDAVDLSNEEWHYDDGDSFLIDQHGDQIADFRDAAGDRQFRHTAGRLCAASPQMLSTLILLREYLEDPLYDHAKMMDTAVELIDACLKVTEQPKQE